MSDSNREQRKREKMIRQTKELIQMHRDKVGLSRPSTKSELVPLLSSNLNSSPISMENFVLIGPVLVQFDDDENYLGISDDTDLLELIRRKAPPHDL